MPEVMWTVVLILVVFVQVIQSVGDWCVKRVSKR
jgi:D-methionine transport system permease protein